jgi:hypothetical protein
MKNIVRCLLISFTWWSVSGCTYAIQMPTPNERRVMMKYLSDDAGIDSFRTEKEFADGMKAAEGELHSAGGFAHPAFRSGFAFCKNIQVYANDASAAYEGWGWTLAAVGAAGTGALTTFAATEGEQSASVAAGAGAAMSAAVVAFGTYLLSRAAHAERAASAASAGLLEANNERAWNVCTRARVQWQANNADSKDEAVANIKKRLSSSAGSASERTPPAAASDESVPSAEGTPSQSLDTH